MSKLIVRPATGREEIARFNELPYVLNEEFGRDVDEGRRRPGWMWMALRSDRLVGRVAWWARDNKATEPMVMDVFDLAADEPLETGVELFRTASKQVLPSRIRPLDFLTFVPPNWRDDPDARRTIQTRISALEQAGARVFVERLRLEWIAGTVIAPPSERLLFRPVNDDQELISLMARVLEGTLDAHSRRDLENGSAAEVARDQYHGDFLGDPKPRDWWRIATLPTGEEVGFVIPARNAYNAIIAYVGVVPEHRGRGYIDDILAKGTRIIAAHDVKRIRAATDVGNRPMAEAFARNGYRTEGGQINMSWD
ncbi:MAG TPA: GNAT family N-acetyltransferase [Candidatus Limnocylindrales bacterium]|nr:GNAT family N-acetyltransferase [Candidatus Limnocylindrales bacterium]